MLNAVADTFGAQGNLIGGALFVLLSHGARRAAGGSPGDVDGPAAATALAAPAPAVATTSAVEDAPVVKKAPTKKVPVVTKAGVHA